MTGEVPTLLSGWLSHAQLQVPHLPVHVLCRQQPASLLPLIELQSDLRGAPCIASMDQ